jgi:hypothetical protein
MFEFRPGFGKALNLSPERRFVFWHVAEDARFVLVLQIMPERIDRRVAGKIALSIKFYIEIR